jgi:hypothetical protein
MDEVIQALTTKKSAFSSQGIFTITLYIYYTETFAPVVKMGTFCVIVDFAVKNELQISSLDVWMAFLNGDLQEMIYMDQPQGYTDVEKQNYK